MTRISASFLLAALATSVLRTDAGKLMLCARNDSILRFPKAPLRLNTDVEARAVQDFLQDAAVRCSIFILRFLLIFPQCSNITTGLSSGLSSALAVLGQIKTYVMSSSLWHWPHLNFMSAPTPPCRKTLQL
jgi:hypothetical protein